MMKAKRTYRLSSLCLRLGLFLAVALFGYSSQGQDLSKSLPDFVPMQINPANAGTGAKMRAVLDSRSQWKSLGTPTKSLAASFDMILTPQHRTNLYESRMAAGIGLSRTQFNPDGVSQFRVDLAYAYHVQIGSTSCLGGGLSIGIDQHTFASGDGKWASQFNGTFYDPGLPSGETRVPDQELSMDFGAGIVFHSKNPTNKRKWTIDNSISAGISAYHLGRIKMSETNSLTDGETARFTAFVEVELGIGKRTGIQPIVYSQLHQGQLEVFGGSRIKYVVNAGESFMNDTKPMYVAMGAFYRSNQAFVIDAQLAWSAYQIGLAYDFQMGAVGEQTDGRGGFELGLMWNFNGKR